MQLTPEHFNRHLANMGQTVQWRRAFACPCVNPHSGAAAPKCPQCHGLGRLWDAPVSGVTAFAGQKVQQAWANFGRWEDGDMVLSIPSDSPVYAIGQFDRVTMAQSSTPYSVNVPPGDRLRFPVLSVDRAFYIDAAGATQEISGVAIDAASGAVTLPPIGRTISLTGRRAPDYFCFGDFAQDRAFHSGADLPRRVVLRKFDLFGRSVRAAEQ